MADDHIYGESKESSTRLDDIKYYTSMLLGTLCIVCVFGFLFLVPFVLDPAISTIMHEFIEKPVHCKVMSYEQRYGKTNCSWASCREGCTAQIYKCHQVRVTYTPRRQYQNNTGVEEIQDNEWAYLTRTERQADPDTGAPLTDENGNMLEHVVEDTPLLINIKGCGYPPEVNCDLYAEKYSNHSATETTFPCYYSKMNPWIVLSNYDRTETISNILSAILIPNVLFVLSIIVLIYWYCPYCQNHCKAPRTVSEQFNARTEDISDLLDDFTDRDN